MTLHSGIEIPTGKIDDLCRRYGIQQLAVFGAAARGDMRPDSDVDVLVEFFPGVVHGWDYFGTEDELAQLFGRRVDLATTKWLKPGIRAPESFPKPASYMRRDSERVADILEAAGQVALYIKSRTREDFVIDRIFQDALIP